MSANHHIRMVIMVLRQTGERCGTVLGRWPAIAVIGFGIGAAGLLAACERGRVDRTDAGAEATEATLYPDLGDRSMFRLRVLQKKIREFADTAGALPPTISEAIIDLPATGQRDLHRDAWNTPIVYTVQGSDFELRSAGADRVTGTNDDLTMRSDTAPSP
jgi:hypothetical protein